VWITEPSAARQLERSTCQTCAAAAISIARAVAPASRRARNVPELLPLPLVRSRMPLKRAPGIACSSLTLPGSTSSSSASKTGRVVRTPCPISERVTQSVIVSSGAISM